MPIHFEDVTGTIDRPKSEGEPPQKAAPAADQDVAAQLESALRLIAERAARLSSD
jgi:hypothetical protein